MADENIEQLPSNLENLLSPFCYEPETALPKTIPEVPGGMYLSGFVSQDCSWGCCYNHSVIKCFPVDRYFDDSHTSFAAHSSNISVAVSSSSYTFVGAAITCVTELAIHNLRTSSGMRKLLLGISYNADNNNKDVRGAVVLFDPIRCAPMKWIEIPDPVSSITVLSHFEEGGSNRPFFNETMMAMVGIAAVGLRGGSVIIIDLGLDDPNLSSVADIRNASDLRYRLLYVNPHEYVIATKRHKAVSKRSLIALRFANEPEDEMVAEAFYYCKPTGESIMAFHKNSVAVTCLEYVPAIGSLLVGFTCGGFQIWRVNNMELQFSSELLIKDDPVHVFGFSFQQPVDDPKNYCYIWVMYGSKSAECTTNTQVELHSLYYERKNYIENFGFVYDGFKQCAKRLTIPLVDDFLTADSENEDFDTIRCSARPIRIWAQPESDLMYCAWEVGRGGIFYLGAFDLNQWYSNHTKEDLYFTPDNGLCPYWVALPVEIPDVSNFVMDVKILPKSVMRWENPHAKLDVHLYPASLSFRAVCLTNTGVSAFEHFGIQEKLVRIILKDGPSLMIQPENVRNACTRYGLEPVFPHVYGEHLSKKDQDRFFILTVLLENRRTPAIIRLASVWLDGSYANVGCTIDLIIDWIGGYMVALRGGADDHWHNLFDFADYTLPPETVRYINFSNFAWTSLHRLLLTLMGPSEVYSVRRQELENMEFGLGKLVQYSASLLMMYKARLLPECDGQFIKNLTDYYQQRRLEARNALETCTYIDNQFKKSHPLMIDHLMDNLMGEDLREEWHVEEGEYAYPPQHVGYLVNMFMWPDVDPKAISRVFMYFLIDLSLFSQDADTSRPNSAVERKVRGDFKAVTDSTAEEYQEIYVLWLLDHGIPNEILVHLKENDRLYQKDGLPWCAATVALTALGYENDVVELLLKSCPQNLARLLFSLMTSTNSKYSSLVELMVSSNLSADEQLLQHFFEISESRDRLAEFIRMKSKELSPAVRSSLLTFLNNTVSVKRLSLLLMFYVHTEDYEKLAEEFVRVRERLGHQNLSDNERKMWRFQENYINHLLSTRKAVRVQQFLRLQSHQSVRSVQTTISIRPVPVTETDESPPEEIPHREKREPKLPPHIRRIKLSESIAQDPLSPLRRYAGRIQSAVSATEPEGENEEQRSRRFSTRRSISRRISMSMSRHSLAHNANATCNESLTIEEKLNTTSNNCHIDLISLLKTPAVDHRIDKQRTSFISANQSVSQGLGESIMQIAEPAIHSIMKEADPSKPKVTRKVELRFENLSLSSEEGEGKNATFYEDADENMDDENNLEKSAFEASFNSAIDKSLFESDSVASVSLPPVDEGQDQEIVDMPHDEPQHGDTSQSDRLPVEEKESLSTVTENPSTEPCDPTIDQSLFGNEPVADASLPQEDVHQQIEGLPLDSITEEDVVAAVDDVGKVASRRTSRATRSTTPTRETTTGTDTDCSDTKSTRRSTRSTRSKTPTREVTGESDAATDDGEKVASRRSLRANRSMTPTRETITGTDTDGSDTKSVRRSTRSTRSKPPTREAEIKSEGSPTKTTRQKRRSSATPSREVSIDEASKNEDASKVKAAKKSETAEPLFSEEGEEKNASFNEDADENMDVENSLENPGSEASFNNAITNKSLFESESVAGVSLPHEDEDRDQEIVDVPLDEAQHSDISRNDPMTLEQKEHLPTVIESPSSEPCESITDQSLFQNASVAETSLQNEDVHQQAENTSLDTSEQDVVAVVDDMEKVTSRRKIRATRSTTPTREAITGTDTDGSDTKSRRRSTRSTRSRTPTRESISEQTAITDDMEKISSKRTLRATRSTTPTREAITGTDTDGSDTKSTRRTTRSTRSKTPTREMAGEPEPVIDDLEKVASRRTLRATRSTTPTREAITGTDTDGSDTKSVRRSTRSTRSKTPTRDAELKSEGSPTKITRQRSRASKTPSREVSIEETSRNEDTSEVKAPKRSRMADKSKPTVAPEPSSSSSFNFELTQEDMEEVADEVETIEIPTTSKKPKTGISKARKRRLKYLHHEQDLSTVIEDSETERSEASVFEATLLPAQTDPPKKKRIKGIKARPTEEEPEPEIEPTKPSKRRKAAAIVADFDEDDQVDVQSQVSSRSARSSSSRRSTGSTKAKSSRRKVKSLSKSST